MGSRARWALLLAAACAASVGFVYVEQQSLALGGAPDQSRTSVVGDANIDQAWQGVWERTPAAYSAVRRELRGYQVLKRAAQAPALAQGQSILRGYSTVLGAPHGERKPAPDPDAEKKRRLYDAFILHGGTEAQLYDAAAHDKELTAYNNVLAFNDKLPAHAIQGPAGKAIKSSKDELSSYSSILDFSTPLPVFKKTKTLVRSHKDVLSFPGSADDARHLAERERNSRNLDPASVASEHAAHSNILTFPGDEGDAVRISQREAAHKVLDESALKAERQAHKNILDFSATPDEEEARAKDTSPHASRTKQPEADSKEIKNYDSILEFPGQRRLNVLQHPQQGSKELKGYSGILDFSGHAGKSEPAGKASSVGKVGSKSKGGKSKAEEGKSEEKREAPTMLLDEALVQQTVEEEKAMEEKAILIEPPEKVEGSPIAAKLAHLYREASRLISDESKPAAAAKPASPAPPVKTVVTHTGVRKGTSSAAAIIAEWKDKENDETHAVKTAAPSEAPQHAAAVGERRRVASGGANARRRLSRDPVLRRLQWQAARLRARLRAREEERKRKEAKEMLEKEALSHVLSHKEKLLKLDEKLEQKLSHKTKRGLKRADTSMTRMIQDDEAKLTVLEAAKARRAAEAARRRERQSRLRHLSQAEQKRIQLVREHALLLAKIHELRKNLPKIYADGVVAAAGPGLAHEDAAPTAALHEAATQELAELHTVSAHAPELSSEAKVEYARKLSRAEVVLHEARTMAHGILNNRHHTASALADVAKVDMDLEAIANVLKDRALHVVLDGKESDEHLHHQSLHQLVDAAAAHAGRLLGESAGGAEGLDPVSFGSELGHVMQELRDSAEAHTDAHVATKGRQQLLRSLLTQERNGKRRLRRAMTSLHRHVRRPRAPHSLLRKTAVALEDSGDYVEPLHARAVLLPKDGQVGAHVHARDGERAERQGEAEWKRARRLAGDANLLSKHPDSPEVLSKEGKADEDRALKTDISALVDATQRVDVKQYDSMLKAAISKNEKKLAQFDEAQSSEARQVWSGLASADRVFADAPREKRANAVSDAMRAAKRIEHTLHLKFDKKGAISESSAPPAEKVAHGKHYIPGLGNVHKDSGLIAALFKHHRVPVAKAEAMEAPKIHQLSKFTHARLTDHAVFHSKGVARRETLKQPSAWRMVDHDADKAILDGSVVGKDVAEVTGSLFQGLTDDSRKRSGDAKANSLWHYI